MSDLSDRNRNPLLSCFIDYKLINSFMTRMDHFVWLFFLLFVSAVPAVAKQRSYKELLAVMDKADESWSGENVGPVGLEKLRLEYVKTWTRTDIVLLGRNLEFSFNETWSDVILQRWGMIDHDAGLWCFLRYFKADRAERKERPYDFRTDKWRYTDYPAKHVARCLLEVLIGWAEKDPIEAWRTLVEIDREISKYGLLDHMPTKRLRVLAEKVARADPKFALGEFWRGPSLIRSEMLAGMSRGFPVGYPWKDLMREVASSRKVDDPGVRHILLGPLMGRWMEDDVKEAVKWFRSPEGELISQVFQRSTDWESYVSVSFSEAKVTATLASAVSFWHSRTPAAARSWLREHTELLTEMMTIHPFSYWEPQESREMRKTLVYCLDKMERERLVESLVGNSMVRLFSGDRNRLVTEVEELGVSDGLESRILQELNRRWSLEGW